MKKAINWWAFPAGLSYQETVGMAKDAGFEGIEPVLNEKGFFSLESPRSEFEYLRAEADAARIELTSLATGLYWQYPFTSDDPDIRAKGVEIAKFQLNAASWLGVDCILVVPGNIVSTATRETALESYDVYYDRALDAVRSLIPEAEKTDVTIGIENVWNQFLLTPREMKGFIDAAGSDKVASYLDVGNMVLFGYPQQWVRTLGSRVKRVHCKDFKKSIGNFDGFVDLLAGDVDYPAVMKELEAIGYDGWLIAEMGGYPRYADQIVYNTSAAMDRILGRKGGRVCSR